MQVNKISGQPIFCQLLSYLPKEIISNQVGLHQSDRYYKKMTTYKQLVFLFYGILSKSPSLRGLCKSLLFLEGKLSYLGIDEIAPVSTLSDANVNRFCGVFEDIYNDLFQHYAKSLEGGFVCLPINGEADCSKIERFDATTFSLFVDVFKGAGRTAEDGKKSGGIKAQTLISYDSLVPKFIQLGAAAKNDKDFLGQLEVEKGHTYVFDKGYVSYSKYQQWTNEGVFFVTRLNDNANYKTIESKPNKNKDSWGVLSEETISIYVAASKSALKLRLITYKDPVKGKVLKFITNHYEYEADTIALIYKNRWAIEPFFKQLKQNFQLGRFFSDSQQGIQTQIWVAFIANLIFTVLYQQVKQAEAFSTIVTMASANLGSYLCLITMVKREKLTSIERNNGIIQLEIFNTFKGGLFQNNKKYP